MQAIPHVDRVTLRVDICGTAPQLALSAYRKELSKNVLRKVILGEGAF